ncbi:MAG: hypothetical protein JSV66_06190 [Trueperaceae bacterium]|nr:MAG: hypothetical protein JSV66_06190 [Trueperaceae bacterium]
MAQEKDKFVGIQISPISFIDEGVDQVLDTLQERVGVNVLMIGTVSWLGLKVGRSISHELDGWADHGVPEPIDLKGGAYFKPHSEYYQNTFIKDYRATDPETAGIDILELVIPAARKRGMMVFAELMEPFFKYAGHGSANTVRIPNLPQCLEVDFLGRHGAEPSTSHPDYRRWIHSMIEDHCRNYDLDGIMWCNERKSPLDQLISGQAPGDFSPASCHEALQRGIDVERVRIAMREVYDYFQQARAGEPFVDGALIEFLRVLLRNPEVLIWERFWLERNKDLDRELYGIVKWCDPNLQFGLNVWNRNHFNPIRKAQWPWDEQTLYADWVKPITYQHQSGLIYANEMSAFHQSILRDFTPQELTPIMYKALGLDEAPWDDLVQSGMDPDTYVYGQCQDTVKGVNGKVPVYMGLGVDAPRSRADQARCTPDIVYRSVLATYRAGGQGVIFSPNYASMKLTNLDGAAQALEELGLK